jgi:excisionase family DNA binding protein
MAGHGLRERGAASKLWEQADRRPTRDGTTHPKVCATPEQGSRFALLESPSDVPATRPTTLHDEVDRMHTDDVEQAIQQLAQAAEALTLDQRLRIAALLAQPATTRDTAPPIYPAAPMETIVLTVEEAAQALKIGRTATYELIRTGQLSSIVIGRLRRIRHTDLIAYLDRQSGRPGR